MSIESVVSSVNFFPGWCMFGSMVFSASTTHALRAVAWMAAHPDGGPVLGRDLARKLAIPPDYLSKVLGALTRAGVLSATRGANGGYRLARSPAKIRLAEVVAPFEGKRARSSCVLRPGRPCRDSGACGAHAAWSSVNDAYGAFLEKTTVADLDGK